MRFVVAALVALFVFVPAAQAEVTFTGVPASPTKQVTFDVGFSSPGAVRYDCVHTFPDTHTSEMPDCDSPFAFVDLVDGAHRLRVTATDAEGVATVGTRTVVVDTQEPPAPVIVSPAENAVLQVASITVSGTTAADTTVTIFDGATELGTVAAQGEAWTFTTPELAQGPHTLTAVAKDAAGNPSPPSTERHVSVDTGAPPAPEILLPTEADAIGERIIVVSGSSEPGTTVAVFDGAAKLGETAAQGGTWAFTTPELAEGAHTLRAIATDAAGNPSPATERHITIDTVTPDVTFSGVPASPTNQFTFDIVFAADEANVRFDCVHRFPDGVGVEEELDCTSPFELRELEDGVHTLDVTVTDAAGNARTRRVSVTIDTQPPAPVEPVQTGPSEFAFAGEAGARYECRLTGPSVDTGFAACGSPRAYPGLGPGDYTFSLQTTDAAGNRAATTTSRAFSIAAAPAATAEATPGPTAAPVAVPAAAPLAELAKTVVLRPVSGKVYVRRLGATTPTELSGPTAVAIGSEVDARKGRVRLTAAATGGKAAHRAEFFGGMFVVTQATDDIVDLALSEPLGSCAKKTGTRVRKLWGDGKGRFRTRGRNAVVTVRGTRWLVQDSCDGTLTRVSQGLVSVRDTVKKKTFLVRAGRKYLAAPKRK